MSVSHIILTLPNKLKIISKQKNEGKKIHIYCCMLNHSTILLRHQCILAIFLLMNIQVAPSLFYYYLHSCVSSGVYGKFLLGLYPGKLLNYKVYETFSFIREYKTTSPHSYYQFNAPIFNGRRDFVDLVSPIPDTITFLNFAK